MFSLILPTYNEEKRLEKCVKEVRKRFEEIGEKYEIIIAEDGSTDGTGKIAAKLEKRYKNVKWIHHDKKLGRGKAFSIASKKAKGDRIGFMDVDMATKMKFLKDLVNYSKEYEVVTGSRYAPGAEVERPALREFTSKVYNALIMALLGVRLYDSQCGFKAFSKRFIKNEIDEVHENTWAWDAAILVHGIKKGYSFKEFPIAWEEKREKAHSTSFKRMSKDIRIHGKIVLKMFLKWRLRMNVQV